MRRVLAVALVGALTTMGLPATVMAEEACHVIRGTTRSWRGAMPPNGEVLARDLTSGLIMAQTITKPDGSFSLSNLPGGAYLVEGPRGDFVASSGVVFLATDGVADGERCAVSDVQLTARPAAALAAPVPSASSQQGGSGSSVVTWMAIGGIATSVIALFLVAKQRSDIDDLEQQLSQTNANIAQINAQIADLSTRIGRITTTLGPQR